jgi:hypothetical protein
MTLTRWKLLAGTFGLAVCGIAALAEPTKSKQATETVAQSNCAVAPPVPTSIPQQMPAPLPVPVPLPQVNPVAFNEPVPPTTPAPLMIPPIQPVETPAPRLGVSTPAEAAPVAVALPSIDLPQTPPVKPLPAVATAPPTKQQLAQFVTELAEAGEPVAQPVPVMTLPAVNTTVAVSPPVQMQPVGLPPLVPPEMAPVAPSPVKMTTYSTPVAPISDKKFKVLLQIGDTLPKFEIRDGEDVLLKVVADKVDVKSPTERSELWATLKAAGQVKFVMPGGEGVCDELQVVPGSGEVIASGSVKFSYNWGKVETAVTSERMTFKLGKAPALTHAPTATPVGANAKDQKQIFSFGGGYMLGQ